MAATPTLVLFGLLFGPGCSQSLPAWFQNISTDLFNVSGDILLGGLFPIHELTSNLSQREEPDDITCDRIYSKGLGLALVMKFAVDEINANQTLLPGVKLGYEIYDDCEQPAVVMTPTLLFLTEGSSRRLAVRCNYTDYETRVVAVIGPSTSEMASVIGKLLGFFLMPLISYGASSDEFSDKSLYPSFLRTVPSDKWQAEAIAQLLHRFKWNWVAVVGSADENGRWRQRQFSAVAANLSICVAYEGLIPVYGDPKPAVKHILDRIVDTHVGVVVVFAQFRQARALFIEVTRRNLTRVWIASTGWSVHNDVYSVPNIHTVGTILGFTDRIQFLSLFHSYVLELLSRLSEERHTRPPPSQPHFTNAPCPECFHLSPANLSLVNTDLVHLLAYRVYVAVYSVAQALHIMLECSATKCKWDAQRKIYPWQLLEVLKGISLNFNETNFMYESEGNPNGTHFEYDSEGNPNRGYDLMQWFWLNESLDFYNVGSFYKTLSINSSLFQWHTENSEVPTSNCSKNCAPGQVRRVKGFHSCCYDCIDCLPGTIQKSTNYIRCVKCPLGEWSLARGTNCTKPVYEYLTWSQPESLFLLFAGVLLLGCQAAVGVLFVRHRGTPVVNASGGALGGLALLGLAGGCLSLALFLGRPRDWVCRLQLPLVSVFHTVTLATVLALSLQIVYVTEFPKQAPSHLGTMSGLGHWLLVLACCGVQAGICGWFVQEGPSLSEHVAQMKVDFVRKFLSCPIKPILGLGLMQGFNGLLALVSFMCTFMAVKPIRQYNLARDITFSTLIYCVVWVVFIPVYTGLTERNQSLAHMLVGLLSNMGLVGAYYLPKCHLLIKRPDLNTSDHFRTFLEGAPPIPQDEQPQTQ